MKIGRVVCYLLLVTVALVACLRTSSVLAQEDTIELEAIYPRIENVAPGAIFKFTVALIYRGDQARDFDLRTSGPSGWSTYVTSSDESVRISVIKLEPNKYRPDQVKVIASPPPSIIPEPKDYKITLEASSGTIRDSIELTAVVMPTYSLDLVLSSRFYHEVTANKDNLFSITAKNTGSGELTSIRFSADKPQGWIVEFEPYKIDRLAPSISQEVQVNIKPAAKTATKYYEMALIAEANETRKTTTMNVRVEEPKGAWVWVGAAIALLVVAVFAVTFLRLGRGK